MSVNLPQVKNDKMFKGFRKITKGYTVTKELHSGADYSAEWWEVDFAEGETSWGDPNNGDGQCFTTIHHRDVEVVGAGGIIKPGVYTETAIVTRTDGDAAPIRAIIVLGKKTEIINYG